MFSLFNSVVGERQSKRSHHRLPNPRKMVRVCGVFINFVLIITGTKIVFFSWITISKRYKKLNNLSSLQPGFRKKNLIKSKEISHLRVDIPQAQALEVNDLWRWKHTIKYALRINRYFTGMSQDSDNEISKNRGTKSPH